MRKRKRHAEFIQCGALELMLGFFEKGTIKPDLIVGSPPYALKGGRYPGSKVVHSQIPDDWKKWAEWMAVLTMHCVNRCSGYVVWVIDSPRVTGKYLEYRPAVEYMLVLLADNADVAVKTPLKWHKNGPPGGAYYPGHDYEFVTVFHHQDFVPKPMNLEEIGTLAKFDSGRGCQRTPTGGRTRSLTGVKKGQLSRPRDVLRFTVGKNSMGRPGANDKCDKRDDSLASSGEAPYPWKLSDYLVRAFSEPLDLVCSPFTGTGTDALAAVMNDRDFVGCDVRESQLEIAKKRLRLWERERAHKFF